MQIESKQPHVVHIEGVLSVEPGKHGTNFSRRAGQVGSGRRSQPVLG